jgi:sugar-specific transcriptional regulator TrmB
MKNDKLLKILTDFGLNDKEAVVYLACLGLGPATVLQIARESKIERTNIYRLIDSLKEKGLIKTEVKGFKKRFIIEHPKKLENLLMLKKEALTEAMPEMVNLYNQKGENSLITYYEGLEGMKTVFNKTIELIKPKEEYLIISDTEELFKLDEKFFNNFIKRRSKLNIDIRILLKDTATARHYQKYQNNFNLKVKILPKDSFVDVAMNITPEMLAIFQFKSPLISLVIENKNIINTQRMLFNLIWKKSV